MDGFDYAIVGNEPAGLWLLSQLNKLRPAPRLLWLEGSLSENIYIPADLASQYEIAGPAFSPYLISPEGGTTWEEFSKTKPFVKTRAISPVLWRVLSRGEKSPYEHVELQRAVKLVKWDPRSALDEGIERKPLNEETIKTLGISKKKASVARHVIFNTGWTKNESQWARPYLESSNEDCPISEWALYPLQIEVEAESFVSVLPPLNFLFDELMVPDCDEEAWPMEVAYCGKMCRVFLWVSVKQPWALEDVSAKFRRALGVFYRYFPFARWGTKKLSPPAEFGDCVSDDVRAYWAHYLEENRRVNFLMTTRSPLAIHNVSILHPYLGAEFLYPERSLEMMRKVLDEELNERSKRKRRERV